MYRKIILSSLTILTLLAGCIPVGQLEIGVEPTATPTVATPDIEPTAPPATVEPNAEPTGAPAEFGEVSGAVCFPSEYIPPMSVYFRNTTNGLLWAIENEENQSSYAQDLPIGTYNAFAYPTENGTFGGLYSEAVRCGLNADCVDHSPVAFDIVSGGSTTGIDVCDWYAEPAAVPQNPNATFQTNPTLAGLVYQDLSTGGIWLVGDGGLARPLLDQWSATISPDGTLALFEKDDDIYLADLARGTWRNITNTADRWESGPQFIPTNPMQIFFFSGSMNDERMSGLLTTADLDGFAYGAIVAESTGVPPSFSADGTKMAYSLGDTAWIYDLANGSVTQFEPNAYGLSGVRAIVSPSWSPDGAFLAWWVVIGEPGASQTALAVFDLGAGTYRLIHSYQPVGGGGYNSSPVWSPDGKWLASIVLSENTKASMWVFSVDGEEIDLGSTADPVWSLDGRALIVARWPDDGGPAWESATVLYVTGEWSPNVLDLDPGSIPLAFLDR